MVIPSIFDVLLFDAVRRPIRYFRIDNLEQINPALWGLGGYTQIRTQSMSIVSNNLKYLRRLNGLTQEQFARKIGIKRSLVGAYEEARANPNLDNLKKIAGVFGISVDNMIKTDIRKIRETPGLYNPPPSPAPIPPSPLNVREPEEPKADENDDMEVELPQSISVIVDKYYREETNHKPESAINQPNTNYRNDNFVAEPSPISPKEPEPFRKITSNESIGLQIPFIPALKVPEYLSKFQNQHFIDSLKTIQYPLLPVGNYRAFEIGEDFPIKHSVLIGEAVKDIQFLTEGKPYILVVRNQGILYRRVYNQVKIKGVLLLSADNEAIPSFELPVNEVLEYWEAKAYISHQMPTSSMPLLRMKALVDDLRTELDRIKS